MRHTVGPWQWYWRQTDGEADCGIFHESHPGMAYSIARAPRYVKQDEWEANAKLIASAPDLLEAAINYREAIRTDRNIRQSTKTLDDIINMIEGGSNEQ